MPHIIGLDLGATSVRAAVLESRFRGFDVAGLYEVPMDASLPAEERLKHALAALAASTPLAADVVAVSMPGARVSTHVLTLPFGDLRKVEQVLPAEIEGAIPFDLDEVVWDWQLVGQTESKTDVLVAVARQTDVGALLKTLGESGVEPRVLTSAAIAYQALFAANAVTDGPPPGGAPHAVVDVGEERVSIAVISGERLELARTVTGGAAQIRGSAAASMRVDLELVRELARQHGFSDDGLPRSSLTNLVREIRSSLGAQAARTRAKVERIHLCGAMANAPGLAAALSEELGLPVAPLVLDPAVVPLQDPSLAPAAAVALSLALRAQGHTRSARLTLRRGPFAFTKESRELTGNYARLAAYALVLLILGAGLALAKLRTLKLDETQLDATLCDTTQRLLGNCEKDYRAALSKMKGRGSPASAIPKASAVELLSELAAHLPPDVPITLVESNITTTALHLQGETDSFDLVDKVETGVKSWKCFGNVKRGQVRKNPAGKVEFGLDAQYTCGAVEKGNG